MKSIVSIAILAITTFPFASVKQRTRATSKAAILNKH